MRKVSSIRFPILAAAAGILLFVAIYVPLTASARPNTVDPSSYTTTINSISRDSYGNPKTLTFTISGPKTNYAICVKMTSWPTYNTKAPNYSTLTYSSGGTTYQPCVEFSWGDKTTNTHHFGDHFPFGGPGTYEVDWYVPDVPANGGVQVGQGASGSQQTFTWANSNGTLSPCPPDPQLQIGVWRPSRHQILNRCKTVTGADNQSGGVKTSSLDYDKSWTVGSLHTEYMQRDYYYASYLPIPTHGSTWTLTGVYVCDTYHGWKELHPVFMAKDSSGNTWLSGPQYSTATPSVSGTWSTHSC